MQSPGPRRSNQYERYIVQMPRRHQDAVVRKLVSTSIFGGVPSTSDEILFVPVRSGRSVLPKEEKGVQRFFVRFQDVLFFSGCIENLCVFRFP